MLILNNKNGFALAEIMVSLAILSIILLSIFSVVSRSIFAISGNKSHTKAMLIAESKLNEFILDKMRGLDISRKPVKDYKGFNFSRKTKRFEHSMIDPLPAKITTVIVKWKEKGRDRKYELSYIYPSK